MPTPERESQPGSAIPAQTTSAATPTASDHGWTVRPDDIRITPPCMMNVREVALFLGCSQRSVRNYTEAGILPVIRIGRRRIYRRDSVLAALSGLESKPRRLAGR